MALTTLYLSLYTLREGQTLVLELDRDGQRLELALIAVSVPDAVASY